MRRFLVILLLLSLLLAPACDAVLLTRFCPDTWYKGEGDEFFILDLEGGSAKGVRISDGEGSYRFPDGAAPEGLVTIAREGRAYAAVHGEFPDWECYDTESLVPDMVRSGQFRMGNAGDELILTVYEREVQRVSWPGDVVSREGQVHYLKDGVWDRRPLFIGQSDFAPATWSDVTLTTFVSPDCAREVVTDAIESAEESLWINVYEFTDAGLAKAVEAELQTGTNAVLLLEGGPVGGVSNEEKGVVSILRDAGVDVIFMGTTESAHARYRFDHAKYLIADNSSFLLTTENFKPSGMDENRGWGVLISDARVAGYYGGVFSADATGGDISPAEEDSGVAPAAADVTNYAPHLSPETFTGATVTAVLSPDTSGLITDMIKRASSSVEIEQAYISNWSKGRDNPYLTESVEAARRGADVRILLDSSWFNCEGENDNDEMAAYLNALATREGIALEARLVDLKAAGLEKVHTKGVVTDKKEVLISSINWNENSPSFNREAGVIISHPGAAAYFLNAFETDWEAGRVVRGSDAKDADSLRILAAGGAIALLFIVYLMRRRR